MEISLSMRNTLSIKEYAFLCDLHYHPVMKYVPVINAMQIKGNKTNLHYNQKSFHAAETSAVIKLVKQK